VKPSDKPVARPVATPAPKTRKLSRKERNIAKNQPATIPETEMLLIGDIGRVRDTPKVAEAKRVLDAMSESLAPEGALPPAPSTPLRMDSEPSKVCSFHKRPEPLSAFASNAAHGDGLQSACREADRIRRDGRKAKASK
jgi:hypothetical protein